MQSRAALCAMSVQRCTGSLAELLPAVGMATVHLEARISSIPKLWRKAAGGTRGSGAQCGPLRPFKVLALGAAIALAAWAQYSKYCHKTHKTLAPCRGQLVNAGNTAGGGGRGGDAAAQGKEPQPAPCSH